MLFSINRWNSIALISSLNIIKITVYIYFTVDSVNFVNLLLSAFYSKGPSIVSTSTVYGLND